MGFASLYLADKMDVDEAIRKAFPNHEEIIKGNQEDIDLLIAYLEGNECHLLFLEAKGRLETLDSKAIKQLNSKADRLKKIFGECGDMWDAVTPHFALIPPIKPENLDSIRWPKWNGKSRLA